MEGKGKNGSEETRKRTKQSRKKCRGRNGMYATQAFRTAGSTLQPILFGNIVEWTTGLFSGYTPSYCRNGRKDKVLCGPQSGRRLISRLERDLLASRARDHMQLVTDLDSGVRLTACGFASWLSVLLWEFHGCRSSPFTTPVLGHPRNLTMLEYICRDRALKKLVLAAAVSVVPRAKLW